jgi:3D (Asp-Asp-Asp) domain-containing protein/peptidoglycan hydrolase CwlO-like protein
VPPHALLGRARLAGVAALVVAATCATATIGATRASAGSASLTTHERQVLYELYADDSAIARANSAAALASTQAAAIDRRLRTARTDAAYARRALRVARTRLASRLAAWYRQGTPPDAVEIFLGASSLSDALDEVELWHSATHLDSSVISQTSLARARYARATGELASAHAAAIRHHDTLVAQLRDLESARAAKARLLESLRAQGRRAAERQRVSVLAQRAARAARHSAKLSPAPAIGDPTPLVQVAPPPTLTNPVHPGGTLSVSSTAYALPGNTASGLPTAQGVCAVDPSVIPMGTRFEVPGYGSCVAADTGSAIVGDRIDVWLSSEALAASWGRRQVTITFD